MGKNETELGREVERENGGGDEAFQLLAELGVKRTRAKHHHSSLFIGQQWRFRRRDIFPRHELIIRTHIHFNHLGSLPQCNLIRARLRKLGCFPWRYG